MRQCITGKIAYERESLALEALLELWIRNNYVRGTGPITIYRCEDCGWYHHTSSGTMHPQLQDFIESGEFSRRRRAFEWEEKLKGR